MKIDYKNELIIINENGKDVKIPFSSPKAFSKVSDLWLRIGWDTKYVYSFTWFGRPVIQLPEDLIRLQELIFMHKPKNIIETGIAHGGGLIFYSSILKLIQKKFSVIGVDIEIRKKNREALEKHFLYNSLTLIEGSSISKDVFKKVKNNILPNEKCLVILDSNHSKNHVLNELQLYSDLMPSGSIFVVADGIMSSVVGAPRTNTDWSWNNPLAAIEEFLSEDKTFERYEFKFPFNEGLVNDRVTYWPNAFLIKK